MSFDGDVVCDNQLFDTIEEAWEYSNDMGCRWYFYPFHFVTTDSKKTIIDAPDAIDFFTGMRTRTIQTIFKKHSENDYTQGMDVYEYLTTI
jgi:hypothetical protein